MLNNMIEDYVNIKEVANIRAILVELYPEWDKTEEIDENLKIANAAAAVRESGIIAIYMHFREDASDSWLQVEYYSKKLNKTVIMDYDATEIYTSYEEDSAVDMLAMVLWKYNKEAKEFEDGIWMTKDLPF